MFLNSRVALARQVLVSSLIFAMKKDLDFILKLFHISFRSENVCFRGSFEVQLRAMCFPMKKCCVFLLKFMVYRAPTMCVLFYFFCFPSCCSFYSLMTECLIKNLNCYLSRSHLIPSIPNGFPLKISITIQNSSYSFGV